MRIHEGKPLLQDGGLLRYGVSLNPVNTQGVMGAGVAKIFKYFYPRMFEVYKSACEDKQITDHQVMVYRPYRLHSACIANLPTKGHWKEDSSVDFIVNSLETFIEGAREVDMGIDQLPIHTVLLGAGLGNLDRDTARRLLLDLERVAGVEFNLYNGPCLRRVISLSRSSQVSTLYMT